jgi:hypothetical protein
MEGHVPMPVSRPFLAAWSIRALAIATSFTALQPTLAGDDASNSPLAVVSQATTLERDHYQYWQVDYRLRNDGRTVFVATPVEISAKIEGWVSNSRVATHAAPRLSSLTASGSSGLTGVSDVIPSADESLRCRERLILQVWDGNDGENPPNPIARAGSHPLTLQEQPTLKISPGGIIRARLRLAHEHFLYGPYNALLGPRSVELKIGPARIHDTLHLDRERKIARTRIAWPPAPPAEYLDQHIFVTAPDSLHLEAHTPGRQSYRFPERPVRYATKMRLSYWYLVASGTEGECRARLAQYKDSPTSWKTLPDGEIEQCLNLVGRWVRVERVFRTEPDATSLSLDFRVVGADVGELWIDDIRLEPVGSDSEGP